MNERAREEKIKRFLADEAMVFHVREVLRETFLKKPNNYDTQYLAAARIAIDLLADGFKELERYRSENRQNGPTLSQPGL